MTVVKKLIEKFDDRRESSETSPKPRAIFAAIIDVVKDGEITTEDYLPLVSAVKALMEYAIPLMNVPYVPDAMEAVVFDSWAIPLAKGYADELVAAVFDVFHIPLPQ